MGTLENESYVLARSSLSVAGGDPTNANATNSSIVKFSLDSMIDKTLLKIEVLTMTLVFTLALLGNTIVMLTLLFKDHMKKKSKNAYKFKRMNFFLFHLCLADIYVSLGNILTMLLWRMNNNIFYGGDLACKLVTYFQIVSVYYSTYVLIAMTLDRYEAICKPMIGLSWSHRRGLAYIGVAFVVSHLQGIPQVIFFALRLIPNVEPPVETCYAIFEPKWLQNAYIIYTWLMQFMAPLCFIIVCYASISVQVLSSLKNQNKSSNEAAERRRRSTLHKQEESRKRSLSASKTAQGGHGKENVALLRASKLSGSNQSLVISAEHATNGSGMAGGDFELRQHCAMNFSRSKIKTIKLTLTVIILYIICSTPYFIGMIMNVMMSSYNPSKLISKLFSIKICLHGVNL
jgi:arginine vasopressin receptor 1A